MINFNSALKLKPKYTINYYYIAKAKFGLKDYQGAIIDLNKAIEIEKSNLNIFYFLRAESKEMLKLNACEDYKLGIKTEYLEQKDYIKGMNYISLNCK